MTKTPAKHRAAALLLAMFCAPALAHPGHADGLLGAALHPLSGSDHLLAMVAVGLWAGRSGGSARWQLPLAFLTAMTLGWRAGAAGLVLPGLESGIAASVLALGLLLALRLELPRSLQAALTAVFALLHGNAHGVELAAVAPIGALGFLFSTALLHGVGLGIAALLPRGTVYRGAGIGIALAGGVLLLQ